MDMRDEKKFFGQWIRYIFFFVPIVYLGVIAAVTFHEVIGHGLVTALLGGTFSGFGILIDGMGWARVELSVLSPLKQAIVLAGGALVTNLFSVLFILLGAKLKKHFLVSVTFLTLALTFLSDGLPYFFWDALFQGGLGDASGILGLYPFLWLKTLIVILSGIAFVAAVLLLNHMLLNRIYTFLGTKERSSRVEFAVIAGTLFVVQTFAWFSFDWTQLVPVPQIWLWPSIIPTIMTLIYFGARVALFGKGQTSTASERPIHFRAAILIAWGLCALVIAIILLFLQNGITV